MIIEITVALIAFAGSVVGSLGGIIATSRRQYTACKGLKKEMIV